MTRITENTIEELTIKLLKQLGYQYIYSQAENDKLKMANYER